MSEYQYYEFRAVDRVLTSEEMTNLRAISSRARINSTSFVNVYNFGDFRGDPEALMEKYFDAFVYVANWGTHILMLRLPKKAFQTRECTPFCAGDSLRAWSTEEYTILCFLADEPGSDDEEGEGWLDALLPIRSDLPRGDFRALYLGWLRALQSEDVDDDQPEPPLPPGLRNLSAPLRSLAEFLDIDTDLLEAAAELSADPEAAPSSEMLSQWIASLPEAEKNTLLFQVASGEDPQAGVCLMRRFQRECASEATGAPRDRRTAGELRAAADRRSQEKKRRKAERQRLEQEREAQEKAAARAKHLDILEKREGESWSHLDRLVATKRPNDYDQAITLLIDLRDVAARKASFSIFEERCRELRMRHASKPSFLRRFKEAGLET